MEVSGAKRAVSKAAMPIQIFQEGLSLHRQGKLQEAEELYRTVLRSDHLHFGALHYLGVVQAVRGRHDEAIRLIHKALKQNPDSDEAHYNLAFILNSAHRVEEAVDHYRQVLAIQPRHADSHNNLANALVQLKRHDEAIPHFNEALALRPDWPLAHYNLGTALVALGRYDEAIAQFEKVLTAEPNSAIAHNNIGLALLELSRCDKMMDQLPDAIAHFVKARAADPNLPQVHNNLGVALRMLIRHEEAVEHFQRAVSLDPTYADAHANLGLSLAELGRLDRARQAYETAIQHAPRRTSLYRNLGTHKRFTTDDPHLAAMKKIAQDMSQLNWSDQVELQFAISKAFADLSDYPRSFEHLLQGNTLKRCHTDYNEAGLLEEFAHIRRVFTPDLLSEKRGSGDPSDAPVFIVGAPRSGSTLIAQVLASHPKAFTVGELDNFSKAITDVKPDISAKSGRQTPIVFPEMVTLMDGDQIRAVSASYLASLAPVRPGAERVVDKMLGNFCLLGLIHLALPNARIIHTIRDPVDTCFSCFSTLFDEGHAFSYDLPELGRYYRAYQALMEHWRIVLPEGAIFEVRYEDVVADLEGQARRIVAHLGLEWDEACLKFFRTKSVVQTSSIAQVRKPIYRTSAGRAKPYLEMLKPLTDALKGNIG